MAGLKLIEAIVPLCPDRYRIALVGKEPHPPCNRVLLPSLLAGEAREDDIELRPHSWYRDMMCARTPIAPLRDRLVFGRALAERQAT
jgi:NAD(P)H-nitrite reductase large subunit